MDELESLERLARLRDSGALSDEEFQQQKQLVLSGSRPAQERSCEDRDRYDRANRLELEYDAAKKSVFVAYVLWFFLFTISAHRFYLHKWKTAILQILIGSCAVLAALVGASIGAVIGSQQVTGLGALLGFGTFIFLWGGWLLLDAIRIPGMVQRYNQALLQSLS